MTPPSLSPRPTGGAGVAHAGARLATRTVALRTRVALHVRERPGSGATVLLLHGYGDSGWSFEPLVPLLPPDWRLLAPDQRGHGDSERPAAGYTMGDLAEDAAALLETFGVAEPVTVVGHSMGSLVAQQLALAHRERVARLVLIGSSTTGALQAVRELEREVLALPDPVPDAFLRAFTRSATHAPLPPAVFAGLVAEARKVPLRVLQAFLPGLLGYDLTRHRGRISCPTLLVWGPYDGFFGADQQEALLDAIPGARLRIYEECGHSPHWEEPERFARELAAFVAGGAGALPS
jgi:non-heme chloroperoxidase